MFGLEPASWSHLAPKKIENKNFGPTIQVRQRRDDDDDDDDDVHGHDDDDDDDDGHGHDDETLDDKRNIGYIINYYYYQPGSNIIILHF